MKQLQLLARWNRRYSLTGITTWREILDRHIQESLVPLRWIGPQGRLLDIGTGNGFPSFPILACRQGIEAVLVERSERKSLFVDTVIREAGLERVRVVTANLTTPPSETVSPRNQTPDRSDEPLTGSFDYVISRATLPRDRYLSLASSMVAPGGRVFLYAGARRGDHGQASSSFLSVVARQAMPGRADSFLYVFQAG